MYIELISSSSRPTLINVERINKIVYDPNLQETVISLAGEDGLITYTSGQEAYNTLNSLLTLQGEVVKLTDITERQDKLDLLLKFHETEDGRHKFIKLLDNADKFVDMLSAQIAKAKEANSNQPTFNFESLDSNNIN